MEAYNTIREAGQFSSSEQKFASLVRLLQTDETYKIVRSDLETLVDQEGREILRQLCQDHLDLRAAHEQKMESIQGSDEQCRTHRRSGETTTLRMKFGDVEVSHYFNKVGSDEAEQWVYERAIKVFNGKASQVAAGMRRSATKRELSDETRKAVDKCAR